MVPFVAAALIFVGVQSEVFATESDRAAPSSLLRLASRQFDNLTQAERAVLEYIDVKNAARSGDWAVCGIRPEAQDHSNDPKGADEWGHERDVRASLLRWLSVDPDASRLIDPGGLRILGARVTGELDLEDAHLSFPIVLRNCAIPQRINLKAAKIPRLDLNGSYTGEIEADAVIIDTNLELGWGFHAAGAVSLRQASIGGNLDANGGHFKHSVIRSDPMLEQLNRKFALLANGARITGNARLCCGFDADGQVNLMNAKIGGDLYAFAGTFSNPNSIAFDAARSEIDGRVWFSAVPPYPGPEINGLISFFGAHGGGWLVIDGARFHGAKGDTYGLNAPSSVFQELVWMNNILDNGTSLCKYSTCTTT